jgi:xanthine dehydrogenase accessory factor
MLFIMNEEHYWKTTLTELEQGKYVVLVVIINRKGSAPNVPGAKMFVMENNVLGTVGGGNSEHKLLNRAQELLKENKLLVEKVHLEHSEEVLDDSSGMICSGSQTFALATLRKRDIPKVMEIWESYNKAQPGILIINDKGISFESDKTSTQSHSYSEQETSWSYQENIGTQNRLFIVGGGHVSLALSCIMEFLGFHIAVFDDRMDLPTLKANVYANVKKIVSYEEIATYIPEGENVYITIMTFGHLSDELVLEKLIAKKCRYIGMLASSKKKQQVFKKLEEKGIAKEYLESVHSPIGVRIKSHTPEEIAISIAAEIIQVKNTER